MKTDAVVYTSNTGYTKRYAEMLGEKTGLPVYALSAAKAELARGSRVIYLGWLMAGKVRGYPGAAKRFRVQAVCGVGMGAAGSQLQEIRKTNNLPAAMPVFSLQGGFDMNQLRGVYRLMMVIMAKTAGKSLAAKKDRTPEENDMLELLTEGGSRVCAEDLAPVLEWYGQEQQERS